MRPNTIDGFSTLDYTIRTWRRTDGFTMAIDELSLIASAATLDETLRELERRKRDYFETMIALKRADAIPLPAGPAFARGFWHTVTPFVFKTLFVAIVFVLLTLSVIPVMTHQIGNMARNARVTVLDGLARIETDPDGQEKILSSVRGAVRMLMPVVTEVRRILAEPPMGPPAEQGKPDGIAPAR